jgi:phage antirepressor YoqD-like protein
MKEVKNHLGQSVVGYVFSGEQGKRDSIIVVAQLSPEFTAALVDRWSELEKQVTTPVFQIPTTLSEALQLAANQAKQLEIAAPKIAHYDAVVERAGLLNATQVGQKVGMSAVKLNKVLDELKVYNQAVKRSRVFSSWFIQQGLGELKQTDMGHSQALFTKRGEAWVIERLTSEGVA